MDVPGIPCDSGSTWKQSMECCTPCPACPKATAPGGSSPLLNLLSQLACEFYPFPHFFPVKAHLSRLTSPVQGKAAGPGVHRGWGVDTPPAQRGHHHSPLPKTHLSPGIPFASGSEKGSRMENKSARGFQPGQGGEVPASEVKMPRRCRAALSLRT